MPWYMSSVTLAFYVDAEDAEDADIQMLNVFQAGLPFGFSADVMENTSFELANDEEDNDG